MKAEQIKGKRWKERQERHEEKQQEEANLLKEWCQGDAKLYDWVSKTLFLDPSGGIFEKSLDILTEEGVKSGDFRPAVDKAIFEGSQKPEERERYIKIIRDLAAKIIYEAEQELKMGEHDSDRTDFFKRRIENRKFLSERVEDILNVASKFYTERLADLAERARRAERKSERVNAEKEEQRIEARERAGQEARKKEERKMGREDRREAEKQDKVEELAAEGRKEAREEKRKEAEIEEERIGQMEKAEREAREKERKGN